jgi:Flp pilus assembly pilin Flp
MKSRVKRRSGQTMVEYIIIVGLIAIGLIGIFGFVAKAIGKKATGITSAIDADVGSEAQSELQTIDGNKIRSLQEDGTFR